MLVDSHAHLDDPRFDEDREAVLERAWDAGVRTILTIGNGTGPDDMGCGLPVADAHDWIYTTLGIHPHDAVKAEERHLVLMEDLASRPSVLAIGETGLDYYYDNSPRQIQRDVFRTQLRLANRLNLPVIIHTRDADADTIEILEEERPRRGVVHCFTGSEALADCALDHGLMISFSGIVTFKGSESLRKIAARIPEDRFLVETDCPYLAPVPHRGKRNEPAFVAETAHVLADLRGTDVEKLVSDTGQNFHQLFTIA
jgi:TatD DNase family protein